MTFEEILQLPLESDKSKTIRDYLIDLLAALWKEGEDFSSKRPLGDSGWQDELCIPLVRAGIVAGRFDEDGYLDDIDTTSADGLIQEAINSLRKEH